MDIKLKISQKKEFMFKTFTFLSLAALAFLFSLQCSSHIWKNNAASTDSAVFQYIARMILDGKMPYRDVFDHKGPLIYLFNTAGLFISKQIGLWIVELITLFISFAIMYKISRLKCGRLVSFGILLLSCAPLFQYFQEGNLTEEFALPFISASIYIFADYFLNERISKLRLLCCGFSFGAVCMLRVNMIPVWLVMCIGVLISSIRKRQVKNIFGFLAFFVTGFLLITLPILIWLAVHDSLELFFDNYIVFNKQYSSFDSPLAALAFRGSVFLNFLNETVTILALALLIFHTIKIKSFFDILYIVYFLVNIVFLSLSGLSFPHYGMIIIPSLVYPFASFCSRYKIKMKSPKTGLSFVFIYVILTLTVPDWLTTASTALKDLGGQESAQMDENVLQVAKFVTDHSSPEDEILVCGNWNIIYNVSERFACTKYAYQSPPLSIDEKRAEEYYEEISQNLPKVIVLSDGCFGYKEIRAFIKKNHYTKVGKNKPGNTTVYAR